jgi:hypothetical protein
MFFFDQQELSIMKLIENSSHGFKDSLSGIAVWPFKKDQKG